MQRVLCKDIQIGGASFGKLYLIQRVYPIGRFHCIVIILQFTIRFQTDVRKEHSIGCTIVGQVRQQDPDAKNDDLSSCAQTYVNVCNVCPRAIGLRMLRSLETLWAHIRTPRCMILARKTKLHTTLDRVYNRTPLGRILARKTRLYALYQCLQVEVHDDKSTMTGSRMPVS